VITRDGFALPEFRSLRPRANPSAPFDLERLELYLPESYERDTRALFEAAIRIYLGHVSTTTQVMDAFLNVAWVAGAMVKLYELSCAEEPPPDVEARFALADFAERVRAQGAAFMHRVTDELRDQMYSTENLRNAPNGISSTMNQLFGRAPWPKTLTWVTRAQAEMLAVHESIRGRFADTITITDDVIAGLNDVEGCAIYSRMAHDLGAYARRNNEDVKRGGVYRFPQWTPEHREDFVLDMFMFRAGVVPDPAHITALVPIFAAAYDQAGAEE
jgi:hypothetical protein